MTSYETEIIFFVVGGGMGLVAGIIVSYIFSLKSQISELEKKGKKHD